MKQKKRIEMPYNVILLFIMLVLTAVLSFVSEYFFSWRNFRNILNQSSIYLILSVGMSFVVCAGQIDLSVGAIIGFTGMVAGILFQQGISALLVIPLCLVAAGVIGCINGLLIAYAKVNSFIVTLCTMTALRGLILVVMNAKSMFGFGETFNFIGSGRIGPINMPILISLCIALLGGILLHKTKFGNNCFFLGANEIALNRAGVNVKRNKVAVFILSGVCAGMAGVIMTARLNSAEPLAGQGYEMDAIAAVILGGTSLQGGQGTILGTVIACLILNMMKNGLTLLAISSHYQEILTGVIVLISAIISDRKQRKRKEV